MGDSCSKMNDHHDQQPKNQGRHHQHHSTATTRTDPRTPTTTVVTAVTAIDPTQTFTSATHRSSPLPHNNNNNNMTANAKRKRYGSILRVGSRKGWNNRLSMASEQKQPPPHSPTHRVSNYNHVHDAASLNLYQAAASHEEPGDAAPAETTVAILPPVHPTDSPHQPRPPLDTKTTSPAQRNNKPPPFTAALNQLGLVGLRNLGNTCFLNSSLQCLSATIPLTDYFLGYDFRSEINHSNPLGTQGRLATAYAQLIKDMWLQAPASSPGSNKAGKHHEVLTPSAFKKQLETFAPQFRSTQQQDAQELLAYLLDGIHEDLNRIPKKPYIEDADCDGTNDEADAMQAWMNYLRRDKSLIVDLFQGQLRSQCTCLKCSHKNVRYEPFMYLSLPMNESTHSLQDCLQLYLEQEDLVGDNQWYCSVCRQHVEATKKTDLWILPPILIVHLKRFKVDPYRGSVATKNASPVQYPLSGWDLSRQVQSRGSELAVYDLYALIHHWGSGYSSGHYTAHALHRFSDQWYDFNDSQVRALDESLVRDGQRSAYLLFYNRSTSNISPSHGQHHLPLEVRTPLIRRQSVSRPDLWPHTQVQDAHFREFARSSVRPPTADIANQLPFLPTHPEEDPK